MEQRLHHTLPAAALLLIGHASGMQDSANDQTRQDALLAFDAVPLNAVQLVSASEHLMIPEAEGPGNWTFASGVLTAPAAWDSVVTPEAYADFRMHVEFCVNAASSDEREKNGNSGVYIQQRYELQILDSFQVEPRELQHWDCGSLYRLKRPDQAAAREAGAWQSYDIVFRAARFDTGRKVEDARITVFHNGRLIHEDVALSRKTGAGKPEGPEPRPIKLQGHHNQVGFRNVWIEALALDAMPAVAADDPRRPQKALPRNGDVFAIDGCTAFVIEPEPGARRDGPKPWVWYAPTLPRLPGKEEGWMFDRLLAEGVAIAGIDVGESYGCASGVARYESLYKHLVEERNFARRPALLARSRGGLMLYSWAVEHPEQVSGVAGIYPVCSIASYPGIKRAAPAYGLSADALRAELDQHEPIARMAALAEARVPILHLHGDSDRIVPLDANSAALAARYESLGGPIDVEVPEGRGHDMWTGWFQSERLTDFLMQRAHAGTMAPGPVKVYILSGQSNMVGIGQVNGKSQRWGDEFSDVIVSVYGGPYAAKKDYDALKPIATKKLTSFGGVKPTPYPGGGTQVVRGAVRFEEAATYEFRPGYGASTANLMTIDGVEVYRKEPLGEPRATPFLCEPGRQYTFRIVYFTDAADGLGWQVRTDVPGTLTTVTKAEGRFPHLLDANGQWAHRADAWYKGLITATADGPLTVGCGANAGAIGPELQFGHLVAEHHDEPVLILKASQGNRSLAWDYLPPGAKRFDFGGRTYAGYGDTIPSWTADDPGKEVNWYAGKQYDECFRAVHDTLEHFDERFPHYAGRGYEIAGFVWWQGHKDGNAAHASRYEHNLVHLIRTLRAEFEVPNAPFVIGTIGFGGWQMSGAHRTVAEAQLAVSGDAGKYPEFADNVRTVETRGFWMEAAASPRNQDFHYNGNAETYLMVGDALGRGMLELLGSH